MCVRGMGRCVCKGDGEMGGNGDGEMGVWKGGWGDSKEKRHRVST